MTKSIFDYDNLPEESQKIINSAINLYDVFSKSSDFLRNDIVVVSLFLAFFNTPSSVLDKITEETKIEQVLNRAFSKYHSSLEAIISQVDKDYKESYNSYFKNFLVQILSINGNTGWMSINPEVILLALFSRNIENYSRVINSFAKEFLSKNYLDEDYEFHKALKIILNSEGIKLNVVDKRQEKGNLNQKERFMPKTKTEMQEDINDNKIFDLLDDIQKRFIGQETMTEYLFYNILNNQRLARHEIINDGERSIIFIDGPTGTGKTAIARAITSKLGIPITSTSIVNYSSTGYVGGDITDTLKDLYKRADGDLEKAQRGIIILDEFDKIAYAKSNGLEMKKAVQQQLLDFMGGGKYNISVSDSILDRSKISFDTSRLTFICLGALTNTREDKQNKTAIGFNISNEEDTKSYNIGPNDLIEIGLERELVGRFNTFLHTNEYSKETLLKILKESTISPLLSFKSWVEANGKKLEILDGACEAIVDAAYDLNTGARSLQTVMNNIRTVYLKEVLRGESTIITLDSETIKNTIKDTFTRRGR